MGRKTNRANKIKKRTFSEIRHSILLSLNEGQKNIREIAKSSKINWRTTRNHLIFFIGKTYVKNVIDTPQVRIFEITDKGRKALLKWK